MKLDFDVSKYNKKVRGLVLTREHRKEVDHAMAVYSKACVDAVRAQAALTNAIHEANSAEADLVACLSRVQGGAE